MAEERIQEHDPEFYQQIVPYIKMMPDFRPQETIKKFKVEPQNNWDVLLHELESIGLNEDYDSKCS